uniref:TspO/MBR-related protein n=1 Tax=Timema cristinae TaxID=61476 RepID=A0A7R9GP64_TIMCR|nr:unnamed protein product [Timema cristinae]
MKINWVAIALVILPNVGGWFGIIFNRANEAWYSTLILPSWNPPSYLFAPVWTILYCVIGFASYLIWRDGEGFKEEARIPLILYCTQLILNWIWTPIFYGAHSILWGLVDIVFLWVNIIACIFTFFRLNRIAAYLLFPYLVWISFATALNYAILRENPDK